MTTETTEPTDVALWIENFDWRRKNFYEASTLLEVACRKLIMYRAKDIVPDVTSIEVHGEWNEDSNVRLTVAAIHLNRDGAPETFDREYEEVEQLEEACEEQLMFMGEISGEDYLGENTIDVSEAP